MTKHDAQCHCGNLQITCVGDPKFVSMCHCKDCQRRTGATYNLGAWFEKSDVNIEGNVKVFKHMEHGGVETTYHFCPDCGAGVYWETSCVGTGLAIGVGYFAASDFPLPTVSFYEKDSHSWVKVPGNISRYTEGINSKQIKN